MESPEVPPLSFCYHIGASEEPGYLCIGYMMRFEEHEIDCRPVSMPISLARQLRQALTPFYAKIADPETYVYTHELIWSLEDKTVESLAFHHSKLAGESIQIGRVGCWCPDMEEFLSLVEEAVAEIAAVHPWSADQPIEWFQRFREN